MVALAVFVLLACGKKVATVRPGPVPSQSEIALDVPAARTISFDVYIEKYHHDATNDLRLKVSLLRGGAVVASTECSGSTFRSKSRSGCQSTQLGACPIMAPVGGADRVRIETRFAEASAITIEGLEIRVRDR